MRYPDGVAGKTSTSGTYPSVSRRGFATSRSTTREREEARLPHQRSRRRSSRSRTSGRSIHVLACRELAQRRCDFCTIDFDVERSTLENGITLRARCASFSTLGLVGWVKTGPARAPRADPARAGRHLQTAQALSVLLGRLVTELPPGHCDPRALDRRGARVFVDIRQTGRRRHDRSALQRGSFAGARVSRRSAGAQKRPRSGKVHDRHGPGSESRSAIR